MDLHPEDLLDREMRNELSAEERALLALHLRQCAVCRFERLVREDFRREADAIDAEAPARRLVSNLMAPASSPGRHSSRWPHLRRHRVVVLVAAAITAAGAAAAAGVRAMAWLDVPKPTIAAKASKANVDGIARSAVDRAAVPLQAPPSELTAAATESAAPRPAPLPTEPGRSGPLRVAGVSPPAPPSAAGAGETTTLLRAPDAAILFDRATSARRSGDHIGAARFYRELIERYPSAPESHESYAVLGWMLLDYGDGEGALSCFERYLQFGAALEEDVMLGKALALRRLGRNDDERLAWSALLGKYPGSVHAPRARARVLELQRR